MDTDASEGFTVLQGVGKGRHPATLGSKALGAHAVADAVHRRWSPYIAEIHEAPRMISVMLKAINAPPNNTMRSIQALSVHMPSLLGHTADETDQVIRNFGSMVRGQRRNDIFVGMGVNFSLTELQATPGAVGRAALRYHPLVLQHESKLPNSCSRCPAFA